MGDREKTALELRLILAAYRAELRRGETQALELFRGIAVARLDAMTADELDTAELRELHARARSELAPVPAARTPVATSAAKPATDT